MRIIGCFDSRLKYLIRIKAVTISYINKNNRILAKLLKVSNLSVKI